jgi:hypothetical protein
MIKIVVKLSLLYQKSQFSAKELTLGEDLRKKFKQVGAGCSAFVFFSLSFPERSPGRLIQCEKVTRATLVVRDVGKC